MREGTGFRAITHDTLAQLELSFHWVPRTPLQKDSVVRGMALTIMKWSSGSQEYHFFHEWKLRIRPFQEDGTPEQFVCPLS